MKYATIKVWMSLALCLACLARAEPVSAAPNAEVQRLVAEAKRAYDNGQFAEALARYDLSYQLEPAPQLLFLIGQAADSDGQSERALQAYRAYLRAVPAAPNKTFVSARIARLQKAPVAEPRSDPHATRATPMTAAASKPSVNARASGKLVDPVGSSRWSADDEAWFQRNRGFRNAGKIITAFGGLLCLAGLARMGGDGDTAFQLGMTGVAFYGIGSLLWTASTMYGTNELNRRGVRVGKTGAIMSVVGIFGPPILWIAGPMQSASLRRAHDGVAPTQRTALSWLPGLGVRATF
jgi:hypothetical protein